MFLRPGAGRGADQNQHAFVKFPLDIMYKVWNYVILISIIVIVFLSGFTYGCFVLTLHLDINVCENHPTRIYNSIHSF